MIGDIIKIMVQKYLKFKWTIGIIGFVVVVGVYSFFTHKSSPTYQFITATRGAITETVSITGNTIPTQSVSLGFQTSGTIGHIYHGLGDKVNAGTVITELNTASLYAALQQAQANVDAQQAQLDGLKAGTRQEDIATSQAALKVAQQNLANLYSGISDAVTSGYTKANDAVRTQLNTLFSNAETNQPQITFNTGNSQAALDASALRVSATAELNMWKQEIANINQSSSSDALIATLNSNLSHLTVIQNLLNNVSATLDANINLSATQLATNKANVSVGLTEVNAAMSSLNTISQNIASQKSAVVQAQAQLSLKQAGATPQSIAAQQAVVEQAQAGVASAQANLQNAKIIAPIGGVITQQDAKVGQVASPNIPLVSIIGNDGFEVDAGLSETDVGKVHVGDKVKMTLDAFPNETFAGAVFYVAPSQTNTQGVITYLTKISFGTSDSRLKSGLTVNIIIDSNHKDSVLVLPQYAILQDDSGTFVETLVGGVVTKNPVTLGIQDQKGNVELLSGVTEGEQVINIGLKTQ